MDFKPLWTPFKLPSSWRLQAPFKPHQTSFKLKASSLLQTSSWRSPSSSPFKLPWSLFEAPWNPFEAFRRWSPFPPSFLLAVDLWRGFLGTSPALKATNIFVSWVWPHLFVLVKKSACFSRYGRYYKWGVVGSKLKPIHCASIHPIHFEEFSFWSLYGQISKKHNFCPKCQCRPTQRPQLLPERRSNPNVLWEVLNLRMTKL